MASEADSDKEIGGSRITGEAFWKSATAEGKIMQQSKAERGRNGGFDTIVTKTSAIFLQFWSRRAHWNCSNCEERLDFAQTPPQMKQSQVTGPGEDNLGQESSLKGECPDRDLAENCQQPISPSAEPMRASFMTGSLGLRRHDSHTGEHHSYGNGMLRYRPDAHSEERKKQLEGQNGPSG